VVKAKAEENAIGKAGQRIVMGEMADARFGLAPLAEVAYRKEHLLAGLGGDHPFQDLGRDQLTAASDEVELERDRLAGSEDVAGRLAVDGTGKFGESAAANRVGGDADQPAKAFIGIDDQTIPADDDAFKGSVGEGRQATGLVLPL